MARASLFKTSVTYLLITTQLITPSAFAMDDMERTQTQGHSHINQVTAIPTRRLASNTRGDLLLDLSSFGPNGKWNLCVQEQDPIAELVRHQNNIWLNVLREVQAPFMLASSSSLGNFIVSGNGASFFLEGSFSLDNFILNKAGTLSILKKGNLKVTQKFQGFLDGFYSTGKQDFGEYASLMVKDFCLDGFCKGKVLSVQAQNQISTTSPSKLEIEKQLYLDSNNKTHLSGHVVFGAHVNDDENRGVFIKGVNGLIIDAHKIVANSRAGFNVRTDKKLEVSSKIFTTYSSKPVFFKAFDAEIRGWMSMGQALTVHAEKDIKISGKTSTIATSIISEKGDAFVSGAHTSPDGFLVKAQNATVSGIFETTPVTIIAEKDIIIPEDTKTGLFEAKAKGTFTNKKSLNTASSYVKAKTINNEHEIKGENGHLKADDKLASKKTEFTDTLVMEAQDVKLKEHKSKALSITQQSTNSANGVEVLPGGHVETEILRINADGKVINNGKITSGKDFPAEGKYLAIESKSWFVNNGYVDVEQAYLKTYGTWNTNTINANKCLSVKSNWFVNSALPWQKPALIHSNDSMYLQSLVKLNIGATTANKSLTSISAINVDLVAAAQNLTSVSIFDLSLLKVGQNVTNISVLRAGLPEIGLNVTGLSYKSWLKVGGTGLLSTNLYSITSSEGLSFLKNMGIGMGINALDQNLGISEFLGQKGQDLYNFTADYLNESWVGPYLDNKLFNRVSGICQSTKKFYDDHKVLIGFGLGGIGHLSKLPKPIHDYTDLISLQTATDIQNYINSTNKYTLFMSSLVTEGPVMMAGRYLADTGIDYFNHLIPQSTKNYVSNLWQTLHAHSSIDMNAYLLAHNQNISYGKIRQGGNLYAWNLALHGEVFNARNLSTRNMSYSGKWFENTGIITGSNASLNLTQGSSPTLGNFKVKNTDLYLNSLTHDQQSDLLNQIKSIIVKDGALNIMAANTDWVTRDIYKLDNKDYRVVLAADSFKLNHDFHATGDFSVYATKGNIENDKHFHIDGKGKLVAINGKVINTNILEAGTQLWIEGRAGVENRSQVEYTDGSYASYAKEVIHDPQWSVNQKDDLDRRYQECKVTPAIMKGGSGEDLKLDDTILENVGLAIISGADFDDTMGVLRSAGSNFIIAAKKVKFNGFTHNHMYQNIRGNQHFYISAYVSQLISDHGKNYILAGDTVTGDASKFESSIGTYIDAVNDIRFNTLPTGAHSWSSRNIDRTKITDVSASLYNKVGDVSLRSQAGNITAVNLGVKTPGLFSAEAEQGYLQFTLEPNVHESSSTKRRKFFSVLGFGSGGQTPNPIATYQAAVDSTKSLEQSNDLVGKAMAAYGTAIQSGEAISQVAETAQNLTSGNIVRAVMSHLPMNVQVGISKTKTYMRLETHPGERTNFECGSASFKARRPSLIQNNLLVPGIMTLSGPLFTFSGLPLHQCYRFSSRGGTMGMNLNGSFFGSTNFAKQRNDFVMDTLQIINVGHLICDVGRLNLNTAMLHAKTASGNISELDLQAQAAKGRVSSAQSQVGYNSSLSWSRSCSTQQNHVPSSILIDQMDPTHLLRINTLYNHGGILIADKPDQVQISQLHSHATSNATTKKIYGINFNPDNMLHDFGKYTWGHTRTNSTYIPYFGDQENYKGQHETHSSKRMLYNLNTKVPTKEFWDQLANLFSKDEPAKTERDESTALTAPIEPVPIWDLPPLSQAATNNSVWHSTPYAVPIEPVSIWDLPPLHQPKTNSDTSKELYNTIRSLICDKDPVKPEFTLNDIAAIQFLHRNPYLLKHIPSRDSIHFRESLCRLENLIINDKGEVCVVIATFPGDAIKYIGSKLNLNNSLHNTTWALSMLTDDDGNTVVDNFHKFIEEKTEAECLKAKSFLEHLDKASQ